MRGMQEFNIYSLTWGRAAGPAGKRGSPRAPLGSWVRFYMRWRSPRLVIIVSFARSPAATPSTNRHRSVCTKWVQNSVHLTAILHRSTTNKETNTKPGSCALGYAVLHLDDRCWSFRSRRRVARRVSGSGSGLWSFVLLRRQHFIRVTCRTTDNYCYRSSKGVWLATVKVVFYGVLFIASITSCSTVNGNITEFCSNHQHAES